MVWKWLKKEGYHPAQPLSEVQTWVDWYKGYVEDFHKYSVHNGISSKGQTKSSMRMGKQICQDWASLILNEKASVIAENEALSEVLQATFEASDFQSRANSLIELMMAFGTAAFVVYTEDDQTFIDYYRGDMIYPLEWDNGEITDCAFASLKVMGGVEHYYVNVHTRDPAGRYVIRNRLIEKEGGHDVSLPDGVAEEVYTGSNLPRFQIITPNLVNNVDFDSPFGISVLANALSRLEKVDLIFDSGNNEFKLGKKRIIVPLSMTKRLQAEGIERPVFDTNDVAYYGLDMESEQKPIDLTGQLRITEHSQGLQDALNYLSDGVGLGPDRYQYSAGGGIKTATEVISEKSELYQNLRKHELIIERAIRGLCAVIAEMHGFDPDEPVSINFDDSIITDRDTDIQQAIQLTASGLKSKVTAMMELFDWTEEQAKEEIERIHEESGEEDSVLAFG